MTLHAASRLLAESATLDRLIVSIHWFFLLTALPGLVGLWLCRGSKGARGVAFCLGLFSTLAGVCELGWLIQDRGSASTFYLTAGAPLLVGLAACVFALYKRQPPGPPA